MKRNSKPSLLSGVSILLMVMMLPLLLFNSSCSNTPVKSGGVYVTYVKCIKGRYIDTVTGKPLPCPDTTGYTLRLAENPAFIAFCFNSDEKDISHLKATLSGAEKSILSGSPEISHEPMTISGETVYPAMIKFTLNDKPIGNVLRFSISDSENPDNNYNMVLYLREKM